MTVQPEKADEPAPSWPTPPVGGYTADDLDRLPNLPPHTELIDGSLVFVSPQTFFHMLVVDLFRSRLAAAAPRDLRVMREFTIDVDRQNRPEPDVLAVRRDAASDLALTRVPAEAVVLAVEVMSAESVTRDRETKPTKYARAGIPHYWRVENDGGRAVVHAFELEPTIGAYATACVFRDRLKVSAPFPVDIDLTSLDPDEEDGA